jgi:hypothetical protein
VVLVVEAMPVVMARHRCRECQVYLILVAVAVVVNPLAADKVVLES